MSSDIFIENDSLFDPPFYFDNQRERTPLYSFAAWVNGAAFRQVDYAETGLPIIKIAEIKNGITGQTKYASSNGREKILLRKGDLLYSWSGQPETSLDAFWFNLPDGLLNQHIFRILPKEECLSKEYFYYLLKYLKPNLILIAKNKQTTGLGHVTKSDLERITVLIPETQQQEAIAHILGTLDDKIELNRKTSETLEAMTKALFKSWFVDFDPVRAKAEGRPTGLPAEISDLFPDSFEDSELGEIPSGWKFTPIFDLADYVNGASHSSEHLNHDARGLPIIKIAELKNGITDQTKYWDSEYKQKHVVVEGDILFSWSGNPDTSIGTFVWGSERGLLNQHIFKVVPRQQAQRSFLLLLLKQNQTLFADIARDKQTTGLGHVTVKDLKENVCSFPCESLMNAFAHIVDGFINQSQTLTLQSDSFQNIRDALLPKLISGEIRIPDAERMLEEVGV